MARPRGMPPELLPPAEGTAVDGARSPNGSAPEEFKLRPGQRGPASSLTEGMIPIIATALARYGVKRLAAAKAGTTEDCLDAWLRRGAEGARRRKRSLYTQLLAACEEAWAHRTAHLIELGERTVLDRHTNPRFLTWLMATTSPKQFTLQKEVATATGGLGPAFELVTPEDAEKALVEKLTRFLAEEEKRAEAPAPPPAADEDTA